MTIFKAKESNVQTYANSFPTRFTKAQGCWLFDDQGKRYIDFLAGAGALNYGHNHPELKKALIDYITADGVTHGLDMHTDAKANFIARFDEIILRPRHLDYRFQFTGPTGTNAVEAALKLARKVTGRANIVAFTNGFHGVSYGALAATGNQHHRGGAGVPLSGVSRIPYQGYAGIDGLSLFETQLSDRSSGLDKPAAVIVECVQGEGGLNVATPEWLKRLEQICRQHNILLIVDDIQAGCGRTGTFFSFEPSGIKPDLVVLSKSIGGYGLPMSIVLLKPELDQWAPGEHNGTFRGNNHAFVTAAKALDLFWQTNELSQHIDARAKQLNQHLQKQLKLHPELFVNLKGRGLMQGIACQNGDIASAISQACFERGMIIETAGPEGQVVKFFCPLTISEAEMEQGIHHFIEAAAKVAKAQNSHSRKAS
ncbi:Diaminobutyrate--2-oxoglutarate transaminase [Vibrio stylophorae]|uniref:Diaminobutyrate--2-oxoglutarate transaminase n=1 Tax=Vibrio stylophorae TaxID=659351 RepID=A0ABN8DZG0_9VIBR|nr:diaminobutyrate--2-oxoglutarate transaminase [Vibrio stylophorae]CAH0535590.1 Diaminobutyrate--2-oxoglutarate transaminase [Vibrio stylophorae]